MHPVETWLGCWGSNPGTHTFVCTPPLIFTPVQSWLFPAHTMKMCFILSFRVAWPTDQLKDCSLMRWSWADGPSAPFSSSFYHDGFSDWLLHASRAAVNWEWGLEAKDKDKMIPRLKPKLEPSEPTAGRVHCFGLLLTLHEYLPRLPFSLAARSHSAKDRMAKPLGLTVMGCHLPESNTSSNGLVWLWKC